MSVLPAPGAPASLCKRSKIRSDGATLHDPQRVLATVGFGVAPPRCANGAPAVHVAVGRLPGNEPIFETWYAGSEVTGGRLGAVEFATDGELLFGAVSVQESGARGLSVAAQMAYAGIFAVLAQSGCDHPLRLWNYVPRINAATDGLERYRQFNIGRQEAFLEAGRPAFAGAPAACAVGTRDGALSIHFLASRYAPRAVENQRQVSAYHYPADYGPRSPTFSRAALGAFGASPVLFVSGTASIVGFRSMFPDDAAAQTRETFVNLRALLAAANDLLGAPTFAPLDLAYTVYVRKTSDFAAIRREVGRALGEAATQSAAVQFVLADICRAELLVEIEATGHALPHPA